MFKKRWDELTHSSRRAYEFRQRFIMAPFQRLASLTPWYDADIAQHYQQTLAQLYREWLPGSRVLEVGCGPGHLSRDFCHNYGVHLYVGVDYSVGMVRDAKLAYPDKSFISADTLNLPFADRSFDIVHSAHLFHHLPPEVRPQAMQEHLRVAQRAVIVEETFGFEPCFWRWPYWAYYTVADGSYYRFTTQEWLSFFRSLNIKIINHVKTDERMIFRRIICWVAEPPSEPSRARA